MEARKLLLAAGLTFVTDCDMCEGAFFEAKDGRVASVHTTDCPRGVEEAERFAEEEDDA